MKKELEKDLVSGSEKSKVFTRTLEFLFRLFRIGFHLSKNIDDKIWLQKLYDSKIIGKAFVKVVPSLRLGMTIYTFTNDGCHLMPTSSLMSSEFETMGAFNPAPGDVVIDIGAYVGRYALNASAKIGQTGVVIAVEPDPTAYRVLVRNLELNKAKNVRPLNIALLNHNGICKLYKGTPGFTSLEKQTFEVHNTEGIDTAKATVFSCRTLDSLLDELKIDRVDWIKVDVEGAEYEVLQGMVKTLEKNRHVKCVFEIHHEDGVDQVKPQLRKMGFKIFNIDWAHILASKD